MEYTTHELFGDQVTNVPLNGYVDLSKSYFTITKPDNLPMEAFGEYAGRFLASTSITFESDPRNANRKHAWTECECGGTFTKNSRSKHRKTKKHIAFMNKTT